MYRLSTSWRRVEKSGLNVSDVNDALKKASEESLKGILGYSEIPLVSTDYTVRRIFIKFTAPTTYVVDEMVKVLSWYDNEMGYRPGWSTWRDGIGIRCNGPVLSYLDVSC